MTNVQGTTPDQPKLPAWGWLFVIACGAIPVVALGGVIPALLGGIGATVCYAVARDGQGGTQKRIVLCTLVTFVAWGGFGGLAYAVSRGPSDKVVRKTTRKAKKRTRTRTDKDGNVLSHEVIDDDQASPDEDATDVDPQLNDRASAPDAEGLSDEDRRKIYRKAATRRSRIASKKQEIAERETAGKSVDVLRKQLNMLESSDQRHLEFAAKWHKVSVSDIEEVIDEGDRENWPDR